MWHEGQRVSIGATRNQKTASGVQEKGHKWRDRRRGQRGALLTSERVASVFLGSWLSEKEWTEVRARRQYVLAHLRMGKNEAGTGQAMGGDRVQGER